MAFKKNCRKVIELDFQRKGWIFGFTFLRRVLSAEEKVDAILCGVDEYSLGIGLLISRIMGGRVFALVEDPPFTKRYERVRGIRGKIEKNLRMRLLRNLLDRCVGVFCFIEREVLEELRLRKVPLYQMMNGASSAALEWARQNDSGGNSKETLTVGLVGALTPEQGIESLLEIVSMAKQQNRSIRLRLIGPVEPGYTETLQRKIKELKLDSCTEVTGWLPYPKMLGKLKGCSVGIYCNPSTTWFRAAQPLKICEYLALGKPTVAWDYPGVRRMMADGRFGFLVPPGDNWAFARALVSLKDPTMRNSFGKKICAAVKEDWNSHYWYRKVLRILENPGKEKQAWSEHESG